MAAAFVLLGLLPSFLAISYLLILVALRCCQVCDRADPSTAPSTRFAIVIPAHNEMVWISSTVHHFRYVDYPPNLFQIIVIADNCTDPTALLARRAGGRSLERHDPVNLGKGHALAWGLQQIATEPFDAIVVHDADCYLDVTALRRLDTFLRQGHPVVQLNHRVLNPDESPISYAAAVGRILEYDLFFAPKSRVGGAVLLMGTGMAFATHILRDHPWQSHSCAEDSEYTVQLMQDGIPIRFLSNAHIGCESVVIDDEFQVQRNRWASGNLQLSKKTSLRLILQAIRRGRWQQVDLGWSLLLASRPLWLLHLLITLLIAGVAELLSRHGAIAPWPREVRLATVALPVLFGAYFLSGIVWLGITPRRLALLVQTPLVVCQLIRIAVSALFSSQDGRWTRTPR